MIRQDASATKSIYEIKKSSVILIKPFDNMLFAMSPYPIRKGIETGRVSQVFIESFSLERYNR